MKSATNALTAAAALLLLSASGAYADGDVEKGKRVFKKCQACHVVDADKNKVGPNLVKIIDRPIAMVEGFKYSDALTEWGTDKVWDEETLAEFLKSPKQVVKGTKMAFAGLRKEKDIVDVIAFLTEEAGATE